MSVHVTSPVWKFQGLTPPEKLVLLKLADCANEEGESIYPAVSTVMRETGLSETAVRQALRHFKKWGILLAEGKHERRRTVVYRMNMGLLKNGFPDAGERVRHAQGAPDEGCASRTHVGAPHAPNTSFNHQEVPPIVPHEEIPAQDFTEDFDKLWSAWAPFEMLHGDRPQAARKYAKIRGEGVSADQIIIAARVYCQQCRNTRCKTKHLENWLGQCVWSTKDKGLGEGDNGKSAVKKQSSAEPARVYVVIDAAGIEKAKWWPHEAPGRGRVEIDYPGCNLRIRDATSDEIAKLHSSTGENHGQDQITA